MECQKKEKNHVELSEGNYRKNGSPPMGRFSTTGGGGILRGVELSRRALWEIADKFFGIPTLGEGEKP